MEKQQPVRVGVLLGTDGTGSARPAVTHDAKTAETIGFDSIWVSDHLLMPAELTTPYPFTESGEILWKLDDPWFDPLIWLTAAAVATSTVEIGTNIMLIGLRQPLELAKQIASLDQLAGGRFSLGVGAGWLAEEFEAAGIPFGHRGSRLDEWIDVLHRAWTGHLAPTSSRHFQLSRAVHMQPVPAHAIPILVGGMSNAALKRVAKRQAGWIAEVAPNQDPIATISAGVGRIYDLSKRLGTPYPSPLRVVYNANESTDELLPRLGGLLDAGVTDVVVSVDLAQEGSAAEVFQAVKSESCRIRRTT